VLMVLLADEAQEMPPAGLNELRLLTSVKRHPILRTKATSTFTHLWIEFGTAVNAVGYAFPSRQLAAGKGTPAG